MKHKSIAVASITVLLCMVLGNIIACAPAPTIEYALVINSTEGGSVTTPGEDTFTYDKGTVVNLVAEAEEGYYFVNWTGDVDTIPDVNDATTTIGMLDHYSITANFKAVDVSFSDDFSDENSGWATFDELTGEVAYRDGYLYVKANACLVYSGCQRYFTDFILEVETWLIDGTANNFNFHNVLCRVQDAFNSYGFVISTNGYYAIDTESGWTTLVYSDHINQGVGAVNLIRIECIGSSLSLSVNGHLLDTVTHTTLTGGDIALGASAEGDTIEVAFDNLVVSEP